MRGADFDSDGTTTGAPTSEPRPVLRTRDAVAITVGIVLGAGIFRTPSLVAGGVSSELMLMAVWLAGGLVALIGALCYAELASAFPHAGGDYHYLRRAFGERIAFLYAWARLAVIQTGSVAILCFVFGDYLAALVPLGPNGSGIYAALAVIVLTTINWLGVRQATRTQNLLTLLEVAGLAIVIVAGLALAPGAPPAPPAEATASSSALGLVMVFVLLTYGGWNEAVYISAELRGGPRKMLHVLLLGLGTITVLYLLANLAYVRALGLDGMAASDAVAAELMRRAGGDVGAAIITAAVVIAALTSANATIITGARSTYALGRDMPALRFLGHWNGTTGSPGNALLIQGGVSLLLVIAGAFARDGFQLAVEYTAPVFWFFFLLVGISLFVLRHRAPDTPRPFRVPLYPLTPILFCAANIYLLWSSLAYTGWGALVGAGVLATGALLLFFLPSTSKEAAR
ncbi:MAG TPA: amino acid permease [Pedomonas sp.]|uniref:APC family permease n=1 Tax=Pedomonas sp. TaxID=2976421 RepID=UPI002F40ED09